MSNSNPPTNVAYSIPGGSGILAKSVLEQYWERLLPSDEDGNTVEQRAANAASIDLMLGAEYFVTSGKRTGKLTASDPVLFIPHGEFAVLTTREVVRIPTNTLGLITMRFKFKQQGLINVSGFHVDPGFYGKILYSLYNAGPSDIAIRWKEPIFTIFLATLLGEAEPYDGDHQGQMEIPSSLISNLAGAPVSMVQLHRRIETLETRMLTAAAVAVGVLLPVLFFIVTEIF